MFSEKNVYKHLKILGAPPNLLGYEALMRAIIYVAEHPHASMTYEVYPEVGAATGAKPSVVERRLRHIIERVFSNTDISVLEEYFGNTFNSRSGKLNNGEFIYGVVWYIKQHDNDKFKI